MKMRIRMHWLLGAALFAMISGGPTPSAGRNRLVEKYVLGNGLTVVIRPNPSSPVVAVQAWVKAGSTTEIESRAGCPTSSSTWRSRDEAAGTRGDRPGGRGGGGEINAYTSFDQTVYHITLSGRFLENALDILADTLGTRSSTPRSFRGSSR